MAAESEYREYLDQAVIEQLSNRHGAQWESLFENRWGTDWPTPCKNELEQSLGSNLADVPDDRKVETLSELLAATTTSPAADSAAEDAVPPLDRMPWLATLTEAGSFEEWLVRIGVDQALVSSLANAGTVSREN